MFPELQVDVEAELARYEKYAERIRPNVVESVSYLYSALRKGQKVLVEGANAAMLDIDLGTYCHPAVSVTSMHLISEYINQQMRLIKLY
jgi:adenylosuccinate synthase